MLKLIKDDTIKVKRVNEKGLMALDSIKRDIQEGKIDDVVVLYRQDDIAYYIPITDISFDAMGWLMFRAMLDMAAEEVE